MPEDSTNKLIREAIKYSKVYVWADCQAVVDIIDELKRRLKAANISTK